MFVSIAQASFTSLVKAIPKYFILFDAIVNETVSLTSFLGCSFLVYRKTIQFCMLISCLPSLLNLLISSKFFFCGVFRVCLHMRSSTNRDNFTSFFQIWMTYIHFSCLISLSRTSSTMLNRSGKGGHLCLVPDHREKAFSFSTLSMIQLWACYIWPLLN